MQKGHHAQLSDTIPTCLTVRMPGMVAASDAAAVATVRGRCGCCAAGCGLRSGDELSVRVVLVARRAGTTARLWSAARSMQLTPEMHAERRPAWNMVCRQFLLESAPHACCMKALHDVRRYMMCGASPSKLRPISRTVNGVCRCAAAALLRLRGSSVALRAAQAMQEGSSARCRQVRRTAPHAIACRGAITELCPVEGHAIKQSQHRSRHNVNAPGYGRVNA